MLERSVALQLQSFLSKENSDTLSEMANSYPYTPDKVYDLDEYKRFPSLKETFLEFIPSVTTMSLNGSERIAVFNEDEKSFGKGNTLVLIDGVAVMNHEDVLDINPYVLKWVKIYQRNYAFGEQIYNGILSLETPDGRMYSFSLPANSMQVEFRGVVPAEDEPVNGGATERNVPDFRHTLYWNPHVAGEELECTTSDMCGTYVVTVEGIGKDGETLWGTRTFEVKE